MACRLATDYLRGWSGGQDDDGYRTYQIVHRVECDTIRDGPAQAMQTPGLPLPGSLWYWFDDVDVWAYCTNQMTAEPIIREGGGNKFFDVKQIFTTKPKGKYCRDTRFEDPLLEPPRVTGGFVKYTEERKFNTDGTIIQTSAHEPLHGDAVAFDKSRNTVHIEQNVLNLELDVLGQMNDTLNNAPLWGLPARCIKLTVGPWETKYYGSCYKYYTRTFDFEVNTRIVNGIVVSGFDRDVLDEGTKCLRGDWDRDTLSTTYGQWLVEAGLTGDNQSDYQRFKDWNGENATCVLDGAGKPIHAANGTSTTGTTAGQIRVTGYDESNFLYLGIPTVL